MRICNWNRQEKDKEVKGRNMKASKNILLFTFNDKSWNFSLFSLSSHQESFQEMEKISELWGKHWIQLEEMCRGKVSLLGECGNRRKRRRDRAKRAKSGEKATEEKKSKLNLLDFYDYCALTFSPSPGSSIDTTNNNNNTHSARAAMSVKKFTNKNQRKEKQAKSETFFLF